MAKVKTTTKASSSNGKILDMAASQQLWARLERLRQDIPGYQLFLQEAVDPSVKRWRTALDALLRQNRHPYGIEHRLGIAEALKVRMYGMVGIRDDHKELQQLNAQYLHLVDGSNDVRLKRLTLKAMQNRADNPDAKRKKNGYAQIIEKFGKEKDLQLRVGVAAAEHALLRYQTSPAALKKASERFLRKYRKCPEPEFNFHLAMVSESLLEQTPDWDRRMRLYHDMVKRFGPDRMTKGEYPYDRLLTMERRIIDLQRDRKTHKIVPQIDKSELLSMFANVINQDKKIPGIFRAGPVLNFIMERDELAGRRSNLLPWLKKVVATATDPSSAFSAIDAIRRNYKKEDVQTLFTTCWNRFEDANDMNTLHQLTRVAIASLTFQDAPPALRRKRLDKLLAKARKAQFWSPVATLLLAKSRAASGEKVKLAIFDEILAMRADRLFSNIEEVRTSALKEKARILNQPDLPSNFYRALAKETKTDGSRIYYLERAASLNPDPARQEKIHAEIIRRFAHRGDASTWFVNVTQAYSDRAAALEKSNRPQEAKKAYKEARKYITKNEGPVSNHVISEIYSALRRYTPSRKAKLRLLDEEIARLQFTSRNLDPLYLQRADFLDDPKEKLAVYEQIIRNHHGVNFQYEPFTLSAALLGKAKLITNKKAKLRLCNTIINNTTNPTTLAETLALKNSLA